MAPPSTAGPEVDDFLDVLCADEDLLRAEFDAIVQANWPEPPAGPPTPPAPRHRTRPRPPRVVARPRPGAPRRRTRARQRSPPLPA